MAPNTTIHLPNGQTITVTAVFGGLFFKADDLNIHRAAFPPGWTVMLQSEEEDDDERDMTGNDHDRPSTRHKHSHRYRRPTLHDDVLYISSISNPSTADFKPAASPTRQVAMMLWSALWWYFHQRDPDPHLTHGVHPDTPLEGRPKGQWRIRIKRDGIFKAKNLLSKLERMGLIQCEQSFVGGQGTGEDFDHMFVSRKAFWGLDARLYLFTLSPTNNSPFPSGTPISSRPASPNRASSGDNAATSGSGSGMTSPNPEVRAQMDGLWHPPAPSNPFHSSSHLPTYYPPPPLQYTMTNHIRHPLRPKPPRQGETFYTRYVPSVGQYLCFRVPSQSHKPVIHTGPVGDKPSLSFLPPGNSLTAVLPGMTSLALSGKSDIDFLHEWMNNPRVSAAWGAQGPKQVQEKFLDSALHSRHSFPVIGCWDGKPFGYFEIYWVREDNLGRYVSSTDFDDFDRGIHVLVGEQEFRGKERVKIWLSALVHYCWLGDARTKRVVAEPRVDNVKFISYLEDVGFFKEKEISFPFKQAALMKIKREAWEAPCL